MVQTLKQMKTGKTPRPSDESLELIAASGEVGRQVIAELCQRVLDGFEMPAKRVLSIVIEIF